MNDFSIFVSSSDNYSDIWDLFFDMFQKFWPEFQGKIYLQTETKDYRHDGLNIECTKVGKHRFFGETLRAGLAKVKEDNILLFMIDYMIMGKVDDDKIKDYFRFFLAHDCDSLCLYPQQYVTNQPTEHADLIRAVPPCGKVMFGYQVAFWKKNVLEDMGALPHENPWMSEWYGCDRAEKMKLHIVCTRKGIKPIPYDARGCLHQGKWLTNAIEVLEKINYPMDFSKRGIYDDSKGYRSMSYRLRIKWTILMTGLRGSFWDLIKRKRIH